MNYQKLADIQYIASSAGSIYANPSTTTTIIKSIWIHNGNTTTETVKLYLVPDSGGSLGTADASNIFFEQAIAAGDSYEVTPAFPFVLTDTNDSLQAVTTTASKVTVIVLGDKY